MRVRVGVSSPGESSVPLVRYGSVAPSRSSRISVFNLYRPSCIICIRSRTLRYVPKRDEGKKKEKLASVASKRGQIYECAPYLMRGFIRAVILFSFFFAELHIFVIRS